MVTVIQQHPPRPGQSATAMAKVQQLVLSLLAAMVNQQPSRRPTAMATIHQTPTTKEQRPVRSPQAPMVVPQPSQARTVTGITRRKPPASAQLPGPSPQPATALRRRSQQHLLLPTAITIMAMAGPSAEDSAGSLKANGQQGLGLPGGTGTTVRTMMAVRRLPGLAGVAGTGTIIRPGLAGNPARVPRL